MTEIERTKLTGIVIVQSALAKLCGYSLIKKQLRYNDVVDYVGMTSKEDLFDYAYIGEVVLIASDDDVMGGNLQDCLKSHQWAGH